MKRLGPDLKMPEPKVPDFLADIFYDLHDRRLLAPIALVVVAIAAVPFLLSGGADEAAPAVGAATAPAEAETAKAATLTVVEAKPGLREYRKRLAGRRPTDPFMQRFTGSVSKEGGQGSEEPASATTSSTSSSETSNGAETETTGSTESGPTTTTESAGASPNAKPEDALVFYAFAGSVQITRTTANADGTTERVGPVLHKGILPPAVLPGPKAEVVTYMGIGPRTHRPLFMVSNEVTEVSGEGKCISGSDPCQLIELKPGSPEIFVYGRAGVRYRIKVTKVEPVATGHS
ncbi:MAG TPA: hypothetical protein VHI77_05845 [Solirubrobacterales bacterium]|jgi:hypothetical protein|nr:hypothetical protein [Solirubrobacterales bacterium]